MSAPKVAASTPTPWRVSSTPNTLRVRGHKFTSWYGIAPNDGPELAILPAGACIQADNAALIVRAVNAHAALVELAERVAEHFANTDAPLGIAARAALKLARGGA